MDLADTGSTSAELADVSSPSASGASLSDAMGSVELLDDGLAAPSEPTDVSEARLDGPGDAPGDERAPSDSDSFEVEDVASEAPEVEDSTPPPWPEGLHGEQPQSATPLPQFAAINADGSARGPDDLIGKPTVMWFFPFAGTPG